MGFDDDGGGGGGGDADDDRSVPACLAWRTRNADDEPEQAGRRDLDHGRGAAAADRAADHVPTLLLIDYQHLTMIHWKKKWAKGYGRHGK